MSGRLIVEIDGDPARVRVVWRPPDGAPATEIENRPITWPFTEDAAEDLRWYLEDYIRLPYGVYSERGPAVAAAYPDMGTKIFAAVFSAPGARYWRAARGVDEAGASPPVHIDIRSDDPAWLGLPWELIRDPLDAGPLALNEVTISRGLLHTAGAARLHGVPAPAGPLRVLLVISRPYGYEDVEYRTVARPLLAEFGDAGTPVELVVLRPPTLDRLREVLDDADASGRPFQIVHFDGHGALLEADDDPPDQATGGVLVFEHPDGGPEHVTAQRLSAVLARSRTPLVVLNACQSGALGPQLEATIATRLIADGAQSVVAMAYGIYVTAAAGFVAALYEQLLAGRTVAEAVAAARSALATDRLRPSPRGRLELGDWVVPVHYGASELRVPGLAPSAEPGPPERGRARPPLVGRDAYFYRLEREVGQGHAVLLAGSAGVGKSELARAFAQWWIDTQGPERPEHVFRYSFRPGSATDALAEIVLGLGTQVYGPAFAQQDPAQRTESVLGLAGTVRLLLVLDGLDALGPAFRSARAAARQVPGRAGIARFVAGICAATGSSVLITSRNPEEWLGRMPRILVRGLPPDEAAEYADRILAGVPESTSRSGAASRAKLEERLDGHPMCLERILPMLETHDPLEITAWLAGDRARPPSPGHETPVTLLSDSLACGYDRLSASTRALLVALSLFEGSVLVHDLVALSQRWRCPRPFRAVGERRWSQVLDDAADVGLLTQTTPLTYDIHPALPSFLAARWRCDEPGRHGRRRTATERVLVEVQAGFASELHELIGAVDDAEQAEGAVLLERMQARNLHRYFDRALVSRRWYPAYPIGVALDSYWARVGLYAEASEWVERVRDLLERPAGHYPDLNSRKGALWIYMVGGEANRQRTLEHLDEAERTYTAILEMLLRQKRSSRKQRRWLAVCYHQLGIVAKDRSQFARAHEYFLRALALHERLGEEAEIGGEHLVLGNLAQAQGDDEAARASLTTALPMLEKAGNRSQAAAVYNNLAGVAVKDGDLEQAESWATRALDVYTALGERDHMAAAYHQLGTVALFQRRVDDARELFRESLVISEALGARRALCGTYIQLGLVAVLDGEIAEAGRWFERGLEIARTIDDVSAQTVALEKLAVLARATEAPDVELKLLVEMLAIAQERQRDVGDGHEHRVVELAGELGLDVLERSWREASGDDMPDRLRELGEPSLRDQPRKGADGA